MKTASICLARMTGCWDPEFEGCLDLVDWNDGMDRWNGLDWNGGMEWNAARKAIEY